jgi:hypothetical protein
VVRQALHLSDMLACCLCVVFDEQQQQHEEEEEAAGASDLDSCNMLAQGYLCSLPCHALLLQLACTAVRPHST